MNQDRFNSILTKLDSFIRRYYLNRLIKGGLYFIGLSVVFVLIIDVIEHLFRFGTTGRQILFYLTVFFLFGIFVYYVLTPFLKLLKLGKQIDYKQASSIIGQHFTNVQDKLLNTLQLHEMAENKSASDLLLASIEQKSNELDSVPFQRAIDYKKNKKYLKYVLIPLGVVALILFFYPKLITSSSERIVMFEEEFIAPAPFTFILENNSLSVPKNLDLEILVKIEGQTVPSIIYIEKEGQRVSMIRKGSNLFSYRFKNLKEDFNFRLIGDQYASQSYKVDVLPNPGIKNFRIDLNYPKYLNLEDETLFNQGDLLVPEGTEIKWSFTTEDTDVLSIAIRDSLYYFIEEDQNFSLELPAEKSE
jgi:hypothetical protein